MTPTHQGSIRLFRVAGIDLFLHWSWFLVAYYEINQRAGYYSSMTWNVLEYLALFGIVLLHEMGHSLACRQVGGQANQIVLWPLGGVAYVQPPQRPGATLWSIAAGPLVNVVLIPVFILLGRLMSTWGTPETMPNAYGLLGAVQFINIALLIFNLLPIYPLDGGQILRSLLWFVLGRARSLMAATVIGLLGAVGLVLLAFYAQSIWIGILAAFILLNCWGGLRQALRLLGVDKAPRRAGTACPNCGAAPPTGPLWVCGRCQQRFDMFEREGVCPNCETAYVTPRCLECGTSHPVASWRTGPEPEAQPGSGSSLLPFSAPGVDTGIAQIGRSTNGHETDEPS